MPPALLNVGCEILCGSREKPSLALLQFPIRQGDHDFDGAFRELKTAMQGKEDPLWGYFPQHPDQNFVNARPLPACHALETSLREKILECNDIFMDLQLAFIRLCLRDIRGKEHGGFHVDLDPGSAFIGDEKNDGTRNICRLVFNLHPEEPRELHYLSNSLKELAELGLQYTRHSYQGIPEDRLPTGARVCRAFIPPREPVVLHGAVFWSNFVPHTGVDNARGHFVAGYGGFRASGADLIA